MRKNAIPLMLLLPGLHRLDLRLIEQNTATVTLEGGEANPADPP